ncbi:TPA: LLM class flavin-dependent oxidoreductase [Pseudomonas aeruginosa]|uniref:LLM class flavin-dependent oxidoreductase n=1 Tax=Pseudomonas aeruginosa TaxID=287 RepID=UPI000F81E854|nr:LLM class flavin-dependent oxidoreductase [Pseudomonas aeruginosa]RTW72343.1 LLM class flavin-dependent oxidoreductase [Pseudomonas aeruginosa]HBP6730582.1 LLM class flavin-dependent oxidoreductase [Pseudomonas aeruginosa]HCF7007345.1 LLM class flavin-dependent oxidoreductase [Pseudomonas aeruginosa]HEH6434557.1 LLM class flavin-dependent oxidoreductase [Pseudomonas aeruginosa]
MSLHFSWKLCASGTRRGLGWPAQPAEWVQLAQAVEYAGLDGLYLPGGPSQPDSLMVAAALCAHTRRLGLTLSLPAEAMLPAALAATLQSLQSLSAGRVRLHLPDSDRGSLRRAFGEVLNRDQRHERIDEFLDILQRLLHIPATPLDHNGRYFHLENAGLGLRDLPPTPLLLDETLGTERIASRADVCFVQGSSVKQLGASIARLNHAAQNAGRTLNHVASFGLIARDSEEQAWDEAARQAQARTAPARGKRRGAAAAVVELLAERAEHPARRNEIHPNLWLPASGESPVLVGSYAQVASRLQELHGAGLDQIILHAPNAVREVLRFGERVLPLLRHEAEKDTRIGR